MQKILQHVYLNYTQIYLRNFCLSREWASLYSELSIFRTLTCTYVCRCIFVTKTNRFTYVTD